MTRAVLFDLDDTLIASTRSFFATLRRTAVELGLPEPGPADLAVELPSWPERVAHLFPGIAFERVDAHYRGLVEVIPFEPIRGAAEALRSLRPRPLGIVTNRVRTLCGLRMRQGGVPEDLFEFVLTLEDLPAAKPHPEALAPALARLERTLPELAPADVLYVGDRVLDAEAAAGVGVGFVAVLTGVETAAAFRAAGVTPDRILPSVAELPALLGA